MPRAVAVFLFSEARKHPGNRLRQRQQLFCRHKRIEQLRLIGHSAQSAADVHFETLLFPSGGGVGALRRDQAEIVEAGESARMLGAAAERRLKLAAKILAVGVSEQKLRQRLRIRGHVKRFVLANACIRARRHITHRVSASLARSDARRRQAPHQAGRVVNLDVVQLKVLPGGDVGDAVGVFLRQLGQTSSCAAFRPPPGILMRCIPGASHIVVRAFGQVAGGKIQSLDFLAVAALTVVIALPVGAAAQAGLGEKAFVELALLAQHDFGLEGVDFAGERFRDAAREFFFPN